MTELTKEIKLSDGTTIKVRGRTYPELLDRKKEGSESELQYDWFATCIVEPKMTVEECKRKITTIKDGFAVATALASLETVEKDFQESSQASNKIMNQ